MCDDKNCQSILYNKSCCDDKNCQYILYDKNCCKDKNCQSILYDKNHQSSKCLNMQSVKPVMKQSAYKKFNQEFVCDDKNCQSAKSICYDKKCQVKSEGTQSSSLWSMSKIACKQIGTQPEIARNIKHSASKSCYPSENTQVSPVSRKYKIQSNHSDSRSFKMQSPQWRSVNPEKM